MKITALELFKVPPRWLFLKVSTDEGLSGWGEPVVEGRADTTAAAVREMEDYLIGADPRRIEDLWQVLYRGGFYRGGPVLTSALSGIEQALWDIKARALGVPVYDLLGGPVRDRLRVYGWIGGDRPEDVVDGARGRIEMGFRAMKMNATDATEWIDSPAKIDAVVERMAAVREAVGWEVGVALDFHGRVHKGMAKRLVQALDPLKPMFIEEPVLPENLEAFAVLQQYTSAPLATGERLFTRWGFKELLSRGAVDVVQPDLSHAGGIWETRKIAAMAEAWDVAVAPHCPLGPLALCAAFQLDFCTPNAFVQETSLGIHYNQPGADVLDYVLNKDDFRVENGFVRRLPGPGLGVEMDEERIRDAARNGGHNWKNPVWRNADGSVAEW